jgi:hypothetical protein
LLGRGTSLLGRGRDRFCLSFCFLCTGTPKGGPTGSDLTPGLEAPTLVTTAGGRFLSGVKGVREGSPGCLTGLDSPRSGSKRSPCSIQAQRLQLGTLCSCGFDKSIEVDVLESHASSLKRRPQRLLAADTDHERFEFDDATER